MPNGKARFSDNKIRNFCTQNSSSSSGQNIDAMKNRGHVCDVTSRQFLHISAYFRICAAIMRGIELENCMVRLIL